MAPSDSADDGGGREDPGERVLVRNDDDRRRRLQVVRRRNGRTRTDAVDLGSGEGETLTVPEGEGTVSVEIGGKDVGVSTTYAPGDQPALFTVRDGTVLVAPA